jgi:hypothetical protein
MSTLPTTSTAPTIGLAGIWSEAALSALADILLRAAEREVEAERAAADGTTTSRETEETS